MTTQPSTLVDGHNRCDQTWRPGAPLTAIMVWSVCVPPRPPDRHCTSKKQDASLPPHVFLSASCKEPRCSWLRPVPTRPPDQCKPGLLAMPSHTPEQTHGTIIADAQVSLASQPRKPNASFCGILVVNHYKMNDMALFQWEITWPPPQGCTLTLWAAYFSILQLWQMCSEQFSFVRKKVFCCILDATNKCI